MKKIRILSKLIELSHELVNSREYFLRAKVSDKDFTRNRKLGFTETVIFILSGAKNSLQAELNRYFDMIKNKNTYTKQAFSKGRQRIKPEAFKELSDSCVKYVYENVETRTYDGFHLPAIDGSRYNLPENPELRMVFGEQITGGAPQIQALGSCLYDVLNEFIIDADFGSCFESERDHAAKMISDLDTEIIHNPLYLLDRGYPSAKLMKLIEERNQHYIMRCDKTFIKAVNRDGNDTITDHKFKNGLSLRFRVVKVTLTTGTEEYIVTNLFDEKYTADDFAELYKLRWGIETKYETLKCKLQIENFTGNTPIAVCQDYYATLYLANLAAAEIMENRDYIDKVYNSPEKKYTYKTNVNLTISALKQYVVELLITDSAIKRIRLLNKISNYVKIAVVPVRPGRSFPRKRTHIALKHPQNSKLP